MVQGTEELGTHIFTRDCLASLGQLPPLHQSSQNWSPLPLDAKVRAHLFTSSISPQIFFMREKKFSLGTQKNETNPQFYVLTYVFGSVDFLRGLWKQK